MAKIRHIAFFTRDPQKMAAFWEEQFGFKRVQQYGQSSGANTVWITDGYMDVSFINPVGNNEAKMGINHMGVTLEADERDEVYAKMEKNGYIIKKSPPERPYVEDYGYDTDNNRFDITTTGLRPQDDKLVATKTVFISDELLKT